MTLPPAELFRPILPDLSPDTIPGRVAKGGRLILGFFGFGILGYGIYRFFLLAGGALTGRMAMKAIIEHLVLYLVAFTVVFSLLGGSMYAFLKAVFEFFRSSL